MPVNQTLIDQSITHDGELIGNGTDGEPVADGTGIIAGVAPLQLLDGQQAAGQQTVLARIILLEILRVPLPVPRRALRSTHRLAGQGHLRLPGTAQLPTK